MESQQTASAGASIWAKSYSVDIAAVVISILLLCLAISMGHSGRLVLKLCDRPDWPHSAELGILVE